MLLHFASTVRRYYSGLFTGNVKELLPARSLTDGPSNSMLI